MDHSAHARKVSICCCRCLLEVGEVADVPSNSGVGGGLVLVPDLLSTSRARNIDEDVIKLAIELVGLVQDELTI